MPQASELRLAVLAGDGVGPEITAATIDILESAAARAGLTPRLEALPIGWKAYKKSKSTLPEETLAALRGHTGWILGPTFAGEYPKDDPIKGHPSGYLRRNFGLFANVRPVKAWPQLEPLIPDLDVTVIRENTEGFYPDRNLAWGYGEFLPTPDVALSLRVITGSACDRFARFVLEYATALGHASVVVLHKRTALPQTEGIFIGAFDRLKKEFPKLEVELVRIDTFSSALPREHHRFRLVATTNLFGDIASDQASGLAGGVAVAPSLNAGIKQAMAQAVHGTAADIAGKNLANPTALALSTAMLLRWFDQKTRNKRYRMTAGLIEHGIKGAMTAGVSTHDLGGRASTSAFTKAVIKSIEEAPASALR
ncbi:MAG: isocitrate/isopropylmalate dehydrogenase family protein [Proteobacteria bacterium]|nr:isocitrate/isopropylmalate dehydrogenase family protein [Burkholderiales bacterium]